MLYKKKTCPLCKDEKGNCILSSQRGEFEALYNPSMKLDPRFGLFIAEDSALNAALRIVALRCSHKDCRKEFSHRHELLDHVKMDHKLNVCEICLDGRHQFASEYQLFTKEQLSKHKKTGDKTFKGHPRCEFCCILFFSGDELFEHCRDKHEVCFICERQGRTDQYYRHYAHLQEHFNSNHFLCREKSCLEKKFVVFATEMEFKDHDFTEHSTGLKMRQSQKKHARVIQTNFHYSSENNSESIRQKRGQPTSHRQRGQPSSPLQREGELNQTERANIETALSDSLSLTKLESPRKEARTNSFQVFRMADKQRYSVLMDRMKKLLNGNSQTRDKIFALSAGYQEGTLSVKNYIKELKELVGIKKCVKLLSLLVELVSEKKKDELLRHARDFKTMAQEFPELKSKTQIIETNEPKYRVLQLTKDTKFRRNYKSVRKETVVQIESSSSDSEFEKEFPALSSAKSRGKKQLSYIGAIAPSQTTSLSSAKNPEFYRDHEYFEMNFPALPSRKSEEEKGNKDKEVKEKPRWGVEDQDMFVLGEPEIDNTVKKKGKRKKQVIMKFG